MVEWVYHFARFKSHNDCCHRVTKKLYLFAEFFAVQLFATNVIGKGLLRLLPFYANFLLIYVSDF